MLREGPAIPEMTALREVKAVAISESVDCKISNLY